MSFHFDPKEGLIVIPTGIWGPNGDTIVMLALDTGATGSTINWDLLVLLGYDPAIIKDRVQMTTGRGVEYVPKISVDKIKALAKKNEHYLTEWVAPEKYIETCIQRTMAGQP